ncbi:MAG TPA: lipase family protein [Acidimicrobiales bacterium]|nr:lipase family protein [Acidimicrobiales bacterium]
MRHRLGALTIVVAVGLIAGCSGSGGDGASGSGSGGGEKASGTTASAPEPAEFTGSDADFYKVPAKLPAGRHGALIRYQEVTGDSAGAATAYRIMYLSRSVAGDPIAVTGTALVPTAGAPTGGRRILTIAHGTTGIADTCAPSKNPRMSELSLMAPLVGQGYLVAETDYEGLGTPGRHPYLVGVSEGRGVLDAARAATQLPSADAGDRMAIFGYSQGGHGALWAGQLAAKWTPELHLVGTVAGAPATEIPVIFSAASRLPIAGFLYMIIAGFNAAYPDQAKLSEVLTPAGEKALTAVDKGCAGQVIPRFAGVDSSTLLKPDVATVQPWAKLAEDNDPGNVKTDTPILILHSAADDVVPAALSEIMFKRMCGLGQTVERRVYHEGLGHGAQVPEAARDGFAWIQQRFGGQKARSTCAAGSS